RGLRLGGRGARRAPGAAGPAPDRRRERLPGPRPGRRGALARAAGREVSRVRLDRLRGRRPSPRRARVRPRRARPASGGDRRAHRQGLRRTHARGRVHVALPVVPPARARHPVRRPRRPRRPGGGGMRDAFFRALAALGAADERVWALTGDLGVGLFEPFEAAAPGRYLNVGIAEQTLVGVAAGLAYAGKVPFSYSIAPFVTSRAHDQVR